MTRRSKPPWRNASERARKLRAESDQFCADFKLREFDEGERFGRYLLRGRHSWAEVITVRGGVIVCGDVDTVHFAHYSGHPSSFPRGPLYWMSTTSYDCATEKAKIGGGLEKEFDADIARSTVLFWRRNDYINRDQARALWHAADNSESYFATSVYEETGDCELCSGGMVTSRCVFSACAILARLCVCLEERDFRVLSLEWFRRAA